MIGFKGWVLVAGYGSIGRRHYRNLDLLGCPDLRLQRSGRVPATGFETPADTRVYKTLEEALVDRPSVVIVANPTSLHVETARRALEAGVAVLMEKPVAENLERAERLSRWVTDQGAVCSMAYCFRYHPLYRSLRDIVRSGVLGRIFHARAWQAHFLPSWHPWEDYRVSYAARKALGGGVVRTLDHELDMTRWLLGEPTSVTASAGTLSGLQIDVEDTADMIFRFDDRLQAHVHVSFARRGHSRGFEICGESATAILDWGKGSLSVVTEAETLQETTISTDFDLNSMYVSMLHDALTGFYEHPPRSAVPLSEGVAALRMADAALESSQQGRSVRLRIE